MTSPTGSPDRAAVGCRRPSWARGRGLDDDRFAVGPERSAAVSDRFAVGPERSAAAAAPADARFSLRLPGRERGRFSSTPPSSVIGRESRVNASGYRGSNRAHRKKELVDWLVRRNSAF
jgi:hypothetical protein